MKIMDLYTEKLDNARTMADLRDLNIHLHGSRRLNLSLYQDDLITVDQYEMIDSVLDDIDEMIDVKVKSLMKKDVETFFASSVVEAVPEDAMRQIVAMTEGAEG